jgi:hypothetical protein
VSDIKVYIVSSYQRKPKQKKKKNTSRPEVESKNLWIEITEAREPREAPWKKKLGGRTLQMTNLLISTSQRTP